MTTQAATLADFLLARIAEDEAAAHYAMTRDAVNDGDWAGWWLGHQQHYSRHDPARVLAECAAKRRLIDWSAPVSGSERVPTDRPGVFDHRDVRYINEDGEDVQRVWVEHDGAVGVVAHDGKSLYLVRQPREACQRLARQLVLEEVGAQRVAQLAHARGG